ncbi:thioredoxin [Peribacillus sp. ACCC06369]|uniref:thioredoxin n=2 Tax=Bacillaceae TaxID=186817 RepID=UPI0025A2EF12|nr:thioredoxin [Peribacillus sp. ACCC06369]MDM5360006.1 thioredoxin [Peribacillus sp. ACCC06369]
MSNFEEEIYMAIVNATDQTFTTDTSEGVVLVDFWAPWCGPCKMIAPVLQELDTEIGDTAKIVKVDVDENQETAGKFGVMSIPTLIVLKDGEVVDKVVGFQPKEALAELISKHA